MMEARLNRSSREFFNSGEEICTDRMFDPAARRTMAINPSFRNPRRKEFNALKFLSERRSSEEYELLQFQTEGSVRDHLALVDALPDKKRLHLLADSVLRKLAEHSEVLSKVYNYRLLEVNYEKN